MCTISPDVGCLDYITFDWLPVNHHKRLEKECSFYDISLSSTQGIQYGKMDFGIRCCGVNK